MVDRLDPSVVRIGAEWRTARKPQECNCGKTIKPGTRYFREAWLVDGSIEVSCEGDHIHSHEEEEAAFARYENHVCDLGD